MKKSEGLSAVILAAGKGTRMNSDLPKALHSVCGESLVWHLIEKARALKATKIVVVAGHKAELVRQSLPKDVTVVIQKEQLGSGHALAQAAKAVPQKGTCVVLYCDTPLLKNETLQKLLDAYRKSPKAGSLLSTVLETPTGYGRVKKNGLDEVLQIVEEADATPDEKEICEINVGAYVFNTAQVFKALKDVKKSAKGEYYLTDVVKILADEKIVSVETKDAWEGKGANTRVELSALEMKMQDTLLENFIKNGVVIRDPRTTVIDASVKIGPGTVILPHTVIEEASVIGRNCQIGPFARIRGKSVVEDGAVIGNFVELVRSHIGKKTQVKHLSYLGDARVGSGVNIGAGTITANFDGKKKHPTVIKDNAQIGSGTVLIAPVTIGNGAKTGAGAVVTKGKSVPNGMTVLGVPARVIPSAAKRSRRI